MLVQHILVKENFNQKNWSKKFGSKTILVQKKSWYTKIFVVQQNCSTKYFYSKNLMQKNLAKIVLIHENDSDLNSALPEG